MESLNRRTTVTLDRWVECEARVKRKQLLRLNILIIMHELSFL